MSSAIQLRYYQTNARNAIFDYFNSGKCGNPIVALPTGCHAKGHLILMADGTTKPVEDVVVGDKLMGFKSQVRTVLALARGRQEMRKVIPNKGEPFIVNKDHKLLIRVTQQSKNPKFESEKQRDEVLTVSQYENGAKWFKHIRKIQSSAVDFAEKEQPIPAYLVGLLLGDGSTINGGCNLTTMDGEIVSYFTDFVSKMGLKLRIDFKPDNKAVTLCVSDPLSNRGVQNWLVGVLRQLGMQEKRSWEKSIPFAYKTGSREQRLALLAGLIDTDGYYSKRDNYFEYCSCSKQLIDDVLYLIKSLGFRGKVCEIKNDFRGAYRICITGALNEVPTLLPRKRAKCSANQKDCLVMAFKTEILPEDDYYGFTLDGDHLYLDSNFIVHHNTGKSVVIADFIHTAFDAYPTTRVMMLTHVKKLIEQNAEKMLHIWNTAPLGIYSAGLSQRETQQPIIFAGVQSVINEIERSLALDDGKPLQYKHFGHRDLVIVDECHLISPEENTAYQRVIQHLKDINPYLKVIGFTATAYRTKQGSLTDEGIFTDICYDLTTPDSFNTLIHEGYLSPLVAKHTKTEYDVSNVGLLCNDYNPKEVGEIVGDDKVTLDAIKEVIEYGHNRRAWLLFAHSIEHAIKITEILESFGVSVGLCHSKKSDKENDATIAAFKAGELRCLVNKDMLTTGFDYPAIDLIGMLRPTLATGLWVQMLGRGTRPSPDTGKANCLVLDFAGNTKRLGCINDPVLPRKRRKGQLGDAPVKICPTCEIYNHASARLCFSCGHEFKIQTELYSTASSMEVMKDTAPVVEYFDITKVLYNLHQKKDKSTGEPVGNPTIKVSYFSGIRMINEWVSIEAKSSVGRSMARNWWLQRHPDLPPATTREALLKVSELRTPKRIRVQTNLPYPQVLGYEY